MYSRIAVLLDQLAYVFDGLWRAVGVIAHNEVDFAAIDAALLIYHGEIGGIRLADRAVARSRAAIGLGAAEFDLGITDARRMLAGCQC
jgi:hypothetical protein